MKPGKGGSNLSNTHSRITLPVVRILVCYATKNSTVAAASQMLKTSKERGYDSPSNLLHSWWRGFSSYPARTSLISASAHCHPPIMYFKSAWLLGVLEAFLLRADQRRVPHHKITFCKNNYSDRESKFFSGSIFSSAFMKPTQNKK